MTDKEMQSSAFSLHGLGCWSNGVEADIGTIVSRLVLCNGQGNGQDSGTYDVVGDHCWGLPRDIA